MSGEISLDSKPVSNVESEIRRRGRIADMMLTAHSVLRDRYARRAKAFDISTLVVATVLTAATFVDPAVLRYLRLDIEGTRITIGILSIALFLLSVIALLVDWKERATRHQQAVKTLADVKAKCRELLSGLPERLEQEGPDFLRAAAFALSELQSIPDGQFNALKARHRRKIQISEMLDAYPSAPVWVLRCYLALRDTITAIRRSDQRLRSDTSENNG